MAKFYRSKHHIYSLFFYFYFLNQSMNMNLKSFSNFSKNSPPDSMHIFRCFIHVSMASWKASTRCSRIQATETYLTTSSVPFRCLLRVLFILGKQKEDCLCQFGGLYGGWSSIRAIIGISKGRHHFAQTVLISKSCFEM